MSPGNEIPSFYKKQQPQLQLQPEQHHHQQQRQRQPEVVLCEEMEPERELKPEVEREHERMDYEKEDNDDFLFEIEEEIKPRNKKRKRALSITEADQDRMFESGEICRPDKPYFMTQRRNKTRNLHVPAGVVNDLNFFNLKLPENLDFCDECNRRWPTKVSKQNDGRTLLRGGWEKVCRWNNVKDTDLCLCEFIPATQEHEMFLKISVVRDAARWLPVRRSWNLVVALPCLLSDPNENLSLRCSTIFFTDADRMGEQVVSLEIAAEEAQEMRNLDS